MKTASIVIGALVIAAIFMAIPILLSASLCLGWDSFLSFMFIAGTLIEYIMIFAFIFEMSNEH